MASGSIHLLQHCRFHCAVTQTKASSIASTLGAETSHEENHKIFGRAENLYRLEFSVFAHVRYTCTYDLRPEDDIGGHVPVSSHFIFEAGSLITLIHRPDWLADETQVCQPPHS